jgi:hypothetical protein
VFGDKRETPPNDAGIVGILQTDLELLSGFLRKDARFVVSYAVERYAFQRNTHNRYSGSNTIR